MLNLINKKNSFVKYLGQTQNITNLTGFSEIKSIYEIKNGSYLVWNYLNNPIFNSFSQLEKNSSYLIISKENFPNYTLYENPEVAETEVVSAEKQIVLAQCEVDLTNFTNKINKAYGVANSGLSFTSWSKNNNPIFNSLTSFTSEETYLIFSENSVLPYQLCEIVQQATPTPTTDISFTTPTPTTDISFTTPTPTMDMSFTTPTPTNTPTHTPSPTLEGVSYFSNEVQVFPPSTQIPRFPTTYTILGESTNLQLGYGTKLSPNGQYLAAKTTNGIRVYENNNGTWSQLGNEIPGSGHYSPSISDTGRVVFGQPYSDKKVYVYQYVNSSWQLVHSAIENGESGFGLHVAISKDGTRIAIASHTNDWTGAIDVYEDSGASWVTLGNQIKGVYGYFDGKEQLGRTGVQFSADGNSILASGNGVVRVFDYTNGSWNQRGAIDRTGDTESGISTFGNYSSGNSDLTTIIVGQYGFEGNNPTPTPTPPIPLGYPSGIGKVMLYNWSGQEYTLSQTITPEFNEPALFGHATSMSEDGTTVAVGGYFYDTYSGICILYELSQGTWQQISTPIYGTQSGGGTDPRFEGGRLGYQVSIAGSGSSKIFALSEPNYENIIDSSEENFTSHTIAGRIRIKSI